MGRGGIRFSKIIYTCDESYNKRIDTGDEAYNKIRYTCDEPYNKKYFKIAVVNITFSLNKYFISLFIIQKYQSHENIDIY